MVTKTSRLFRQNSTIAAQLMKTKTYNYRHFSADNKLLVNSELAKSKDSLQSLHRLLYSSNILFRGVFLFSTSFRLLFAGVSTP